MNLDEFLFNLETENTLLESGSEQILRHYTTVPGFFGILNKNKIQAYGYEDSNKNEVAVIRPSGDIRNISDISKNKNIMGYFEIEFHKLNDSVKRVRKRTTNELWTTFNNRIDSILKKYSLFDEKEKIVENIEKYKKQFSNIDYKLLKNLIYDANLSLVKKEGEERIIGSIPIDSRYMKFVFLNLDVDKLSDRNKSTLLFYITQRQDLFDNNKLFREIEREILKEK